MTWVHNASPEVDAESQWPTIVAVCIALTFVMTVTVGLRGYTRAIMLKTLWADDWVILFSAVSICPGRLGAGCAQKRKANLRVYRFVALYIMGSVLAVTTLSPRQDCQNSRLIRLPESKWGLGLNIALRPAVNLNDYSIVSPAQNICILLQYSLHVTQINFVGRPFYMAGITGFKVALCISYLRVLSQSMSIYKAVVWGILSTCVLSHLGGTLVLLFQCKPVCITVHPLRDD